MSLLIKALDSLDKHKQAEQSKKQTADHAADAALSLDLAPKQTADHESSVAAPVTELPGAESELRLSAGDGLTLEEEAGLSTPSTVASKYAKAKQGVDKAVITSTAQSGELKGNSQGAQQAAKLNNKAASPLAAASTVQPQTTASDQKVAAKVFVANQPVKTPSSKYALVLLGVAGALMIWLGLQGYTYLRGLAAPDVVVIRPSAMQPQVTATQPTGNALATTAAALAVAPKGTQVATASANAVALNGSQDKNTSNQPSGIQVSSDQGPARNNIVTGNASADEANSQVEPRVEVKPDANRVVAEHAISKKSHTKKLINSNEESLVESETSLKHTPMRLTSKAPAAGVDPTLLSAYQAFSRGEDAAAQQQYRQVLQRDIRNVDGLLGMAAIAQRQGRDADAMGWYQKVLEIEPGNTIAQSAIISSPQANTDAVGTESRIKSMLAQQPEAANLHAALGNLYAGQNQWPSAQDAYFNASRLAPNSADYAFNLAISLDQLGKSDLALRQYQRALDLLNKSGASSPDRVQLEARIKALQ